MASRTAEPGKQRLFGRLWISRWLAITALAALSVPMVVRPGTAEALPLGFFLVSGDVTSNTVGNTMTLTQTTPTAIVNWGDFSISAGETVVIDQPDAESTLLLRVVGNTTANIAGSIESNGIVVLVGLDGIVFHSGSVVTAGSLIASTADISNADFLAGERTFADADLGRTVMVGTGARVAVDEDGVAALIGAHISNLGTVEAPGGLVAMAAGTPAVVEWPGEPDHGFVTIGGGYPNATVVNGPTGLLQADGGLVQLTTTAVAPDPASIVHGGVSRARTAGAGDSGVVIDAGSGSVGVPDAGTLVDATGDDPGEEGGDVGITGAVVDIAGTSTTPARFDASGQGGGGVVVVTGETAVTISSDGSDDPDEPGVSIVADALATGSAGQAGVRTLDDGAPLTVAGNALISASGATAATAAGSTFVGNEAGSVTFLDEVGGEAAGSATVIAEVDIAGARAFAASASLPTSFSVGAIGASSTGTEAALPIESLAQARDLDLGGGWLTFANGQAVCEVGVDGRLGGSTTLAGLASSVAPAVAGLDLSEPDVEVDIPGLGRVVFNEQETATLPGGVESLGVIGVHVYGEDPSDELILLRSSCAVAVPAPVVVDDEVTTVEGQSVTFDVLDGDSDPEGRTLLVGGTTSPAHGTVTCEPTGSCTYTPDAGFVGEDTFDYTATNGVSEATGTVTVTVTPAPTSTTSTTTTTVPGVGSEGGSPDGGGTSGGGGELPRTGLAVGGTLALAVALLGLGAGIHAVSRRRTAC